MKNVNLNEDFTLSYSFDEAENNERIHLKIYRILDKNLTGYQVLDIFIPPDYPQDLIKASKLALEVFSDVFGNKMNR